MCAVRSGRVGRIARESLRASDGGRGRGGRVCARSFGDSGKITVKYLADTGHYNIVRSLLRGSLF